jgi:hypothetical protein
VLSGEVAAKQAFHPGFVHGENALIVEDPEDEDALVAALRIAVADPARAAAIGRAGHELCDAWGEEELGARYEALFERAVGVPTASSSPPREPIPGDRLTDFITAHMPASAQLLAGGLEAAAHAASGTSHPAAVVAALDAIDDGGLSAGAREVVRYERLLLSLSLDLEGQAGEGPFPVEDRGADALLAQPGDARPVRSRWVRLETFPAGIEEAAAAAASGDLAGADALDPDGPRVTLLFQRQGDLVPRIFRVNAETVALIEACDGTRTVAQIEAGLFECHGLDPGATKAALRQLGAGGVVAFALA